MHDHDRDTEIYVAKDRVNADAWRVEYFDSDGGRYVTIFGGPKAEQRVADYAAAIRKGSLTRYDA